MKNAPSVPAEQSSVSAWTLDANKEGYQMRATEMCLRPRKSRRRWWWLKCWLGWGSISDGSICWYSAHEKREAHDYYCRTGGDGYPSHFFTYHCAKCHKPFMI